MSSITLIGYDLTKCYVLVLLCHSVSFSPVCVSVVVSTVAVCSGSSVSLKKRKRKSCL